MPLSEVVQTVTQSILSEEEIEHLRLRLGRTEMADAITSEVLVTLTDDALRHQVYELVAEQLDEISMREIHYVLDALVSVLRGKEVDQEREIA